MEGEELVNNRDVRGDRLPAVAGRRTRPRPADAVLTKQAPLTVADDAFDGNGPSEDS